MKIDNAKLIEWLQVKLESAESTVEARRQARDCWRGGNAKSWKAVGCFLTKEQRLVKASIEERILIKCQREVEMFKDVIAAIQKIP